jgi:hypothetical protein
MGLSKRYEIFFLIAENATSRAIPRHAAARRPTAVRQLLQTLDVDAGTCRVTTGHNGDDGRGAILPVSARDNNASVRANI